MLKLFPNEDLNYELNENDLVYTPTNVAKVIVDMFKPEGRCLDPSMGHGAFYDLLPEPKFWCEIQRGRNFYDFNENVDWIITNPPYSDFNKFLEHSFELSPNVVFLCPVAKVFKSWATIMQIKRYGGIKKAWFVPASRCGFPFGFPCAAFHFKQLYSGPMEIDYAPE